MRRLIPLVATVTLLLAACASSAEPATTDASTQEIIVVDETVPSAEPQPPALMPGGVADGSVEIDGTTLQYSVVVPDGFDVGDAAPVLLALPPGGQDPGLTRAIVEGTWASEALRLGWVVVSPAAPDGLLFFQGSEVLLPGFVDWIDTWVQAEGGSPHVAGISNGGISSFRYAAMNPDRVLSISAFPGFPRSADDKAILTQLIDIPIRLFVGGDDLPWIPPAEETLRSFSDLGGDITLRVFPGEGHVMASTQDGTLLFEQLESFRGR